MKCLRYIGAAILLIGAIVGIAILLVEPMGLFSGSRPADLGFAAGKFRPCPATPNCVSSTAPGDDAGHHIAPLRLVGTPETGWNRLKDMLASTPRVKVITERSDYLHAEFTTRAMGFVDDVEFALDASAQVIHVRSASRLGVSDFGVNRARIERIRKSLASG
jgi:uncharacterized protein (DUF1499 family)